MKFPLRLTWDLLRSRLSQPFANSAGAETIFHLPAAILPALRENGEDESPNDETASAALSVRAAAQSKAPVLWIGGSEPLEHSEVGRVAFALNRKGRNVFLHTDGLRLRQRIHEFRPDPRLFLTVELAGREEIHDEVAGRQGAFRRVMEGIRAAKLSGFHVCTHVTVNEDTDACEAGELFEFLDRYDVDGFVVSSGGRALGSSAKASRDKLEEIRSLVRCSRWEKFSRLLEASYAVRNEEMAAVAVAKNEAGAFEESA